MFAATRVRTAATPAPGLVLLQRKADRRVTCFYFYMWDERVRAGRSSRSAPTSPTRSRCGSTATSGPSSKPVAGIGFTELSNGFATCEDPAGLQAICDRLGPTNPGVLQPLVDLPADAADRRGPGGGYWWELSMRQVETSRTLVFDAPRQARAFFEALVADNLDIGRPDHVELIFAGHPRRWGTATRSRAELQDPDRHPRHHRGHCERRLQALPGQAVPQRRPGVADRDRHQRPQRPWRANGGSSTSRSCRPKPVTSTPACSILNVSGRVVSLRAQPLSGSRSPPSTRMAGGRPHYGSEILGSWPCSAPCVSV